MWHRRAKGVVRAPLHAAREEAFSSQAVIMLILLQNFPFCIMSVNITRIVIQALREERLSR